MFAHPADLFRGDANHQGAGLDVFVDDGAGGPGPVVFHDAMAASTAAGATQTLKPGVTSPLPAAPASQGTGQDAFNGEFQDVWDALLPELKSLLQQQAQHQPKKQSQNLKKTRSLKKKQQLDWVPCLAKPFL